MDEALTPTPTLTLTLTLTLIMTLTLTRILTLTLNLTHTDMKQPIKAFACAQRTGSMSTGSFGFKPEYGCMMGVYDGCMMGLNPTLHQHYCPLCTPSTAVPSHLPSAALIWYLPPPPPPLQLHSSPQWLQGLSFFPSPLLLQWPLLSTHQCILLSTALTYLALTRIGVCSTCCPLPLAIKTSTAALATASNPSSI